MTLNSFLYLLSVPLDNVTFSINLQTLKSQSKARENKSINNLTNFLFLPWELFLSGETDFVT